MQVTADMISTFRGSRFPLDQRRRDALANYCTHAAAEAGLPVQTWIRRAFDFEVYEAKEVIRGNASEALWERIVKHPSGGWAVVVPIMGAVIGVSLDDWLNARMVEAERRLARERSEYEAARARDAAMVRQIGAVLGLGPRAAAEPHTGPNWHGRERPGALGGEGNRETLERRSFDGGAE